MFIRRSNSCRADRRLSEGGRGFRRAIGEIVLRCRAQRRSVGLKIRREIALEAVPIVRVERAQHLMQLARDHARRTLRRAPTAVSLQVASRGRACRPDVGQVTWDLTGWVIVASISSRSTDGRRNFAGGA
jgi:hypothetical protein